MPSVDIELMKDKVVLSMEDYTSSLEEVQIRKAKKNERLNHVEQKQFRKIVGKIMWLSENVRMDLCFGALQSSTKNKEATIRDPKKANNIIARAKREQSILNFR